MSTQLSPGFLAFFNKFPEAAKIGDGIQADAFAKIRYNGSKWKAIPASGEEIAIPTPYLDVIVVGVNEHKSHTVYAKAYDPKSEPEAPVWSSDDGTPVPAEHEGKVVSDYRRIAVLLWDNLDGGVYELRISAASITNFDRYKTAITNHGMPVIKVVTRITFDAAFDYPKLVFTPILEVDESKLPYIEKAFATPNAINAAIGKSKAAAPALAAPTELQRIAAQAQAPEESDGDDAPVPKATRKRKVAEAPVEVFTVPKATSVAPGMPGMPGAHPASTSAAAATVVTPQPTSASLDSLLSSIMSK